MSAGGAGAGIYTRSASSSESCEGERACSAYAGAAMAGKREAANTSELYAGALGDGKKDC